MIEMNITIVTTIDLLRRPEQLLNRLQKMCQMVVSNDFNLVIGHNDRGSKYDAELKNWFCRKRDNIVLVSNKDDSETINNSRLRNIALCEVETSVSILMDLDVCVDPKIIRELANSVKSGQPISMLPCIYLTEKGTKYYLENNNKKMIIDDYFSFGRNYVMHVAMPSSIIAFETYDAKKINGFDEKFIGHGYEDFDFIFRLAVYHNLIFPSSDLLIDKTYTAPLLANGFRAHLANFCLRFMLDKKFGFHLHHKKDNNELYYFLRGKNKIRFEEKIKIFLNDSQSVKDIKIPPLIKSFFEICAERRIDSNEYYAFFDARPIHIIKQKSRVSKVIKFLRNFYV